MRADRLDLHIGPQQTVQVLTLTERAVHPAHLPHPIQRREFIRQPRDIRRHRLRVPVGDRDIHRRDQPLVHVFAQHIESYHSGFIVGQILDRIIRIIQRHRVDRKRSHHRDNQRNGDHRAAADLLRYPFVPVPRRAVLGLPRPEGAFAQCRQQRRSQGQPCRQHHQHPNRQRGACRFEQAHFRQRHRHKSNKNRPGAAGNRLTHKLHRMPCRFCHILLIGHLFAEAADQKQAVIRPRPIQNHHQQHVHIAGDRHHMIAHPRDQSPRDKIRDRHRRQWNQRADRRAVDRQQQNHHQRHRHPDRPIHAGSDRLIRFDHHW